MMYPLLYARRLPFLKKRKAWGGRKKILLVAYFCKDAALAESLEQKKSKRMDFRKGSIFFILFLLQNDLSASFLQREAVVGKMPRMQAFG